MWRVVVVVDFNHKKMIPIMVVPIDSQGVYSCRFDFLHINWCFEPVLFEQTL